MANGKVLIGFSFPYVAKYANSGGVTTYSNGQVLARGVSVTIEPTVSDDNKFYADNGVAETAGGKLTGGSANFTVDGLKAAARTLIYGLPAPTQTTVSTSLSVDVYHYNDNMVLPYVAAGFVEQWMEDGTISYTARILNKLRFKPSSRTANTQGEEIEWQTEELTADMFRDDTSSHEWMSESEDLTSEADAVAYIEHVFGI